jgi:hypothetical protein
MSKKIVASIRTANRRVCITSKNCKRNCYSYIRVTELYSRNSTKFAEIKTEFRKLYPHALHDEEIPTPLLFTCEAYFHLRG